MRKKAQNLIKEWLMQNPHSPFHTAVRTALANLKDSSYALERAGAKARNATLKTIATLLESKREQIKQANALDIAQAQKNGLPNALIERLRLDDKQIDSMINSVLEIEAQSEVIGEVLGGGARPSGIHITKVATPLGVVAIIYESRPNVTIDAAALCIKSGNGALLKGGKEASNSNEILGDILKEALSACGIDKECMLILTPKLAQKIAKSSLDSTQNAKDYPQSLAQNLELDLMQDSSQNLMQSIMIEVMHSREFIDLLIPRGGRGLIEFVLGHSKVPVIFHEAGICHAYIDKDIDEVGEKYALDICQNAKITRPSACNALECVLVHTQVASKILPSLAERLGKAGVEMRVCQKGLEMLASLDSGDFGKIVPASQDDFGREFGELILAIKVVESIQEALAHIAKYGSKHSEIIITQSLQTSQYFVANVDASAVFVNASSRFNDGGEFGLGAEIGISTQKLHARGPMGAKDLTTTKYIVQGNGTIRL